MTVCDLIEELLKHPPHYRVFIQHNNGVFIQHNNGETSPEQIGPECRVGWASIVDVRVDDACTVILDGTEGVV